MSTCAVFAVRFGEEESISHHGIFVQTDEDGCGTLFDARGAVAADGALIFKRSAERLSRFGDTIANSLGLRDAPAIVTKGLLGSQIAVTHIACGSQHIGLTPQVPAEDTFVVAVYLTRLERHELWKRGQPFITQGYGAHAMRIVHLEGEYAANIIIGVTL